MQKDSSPTVGYALNAFPCETFADWWTCLNTDILEIKRRVFPNESFPIELRFSEQLIGELTPDRVIQLKTFFATHGLALVTVNAFVMPHFHGAPVKERAYLPAWHESDARLNFTNRCVDLLAQLAPGGSVSVPFGALKPVTLDAVAPNILKAGEHAARQGCVIALEPEPGLCVETTAEVVEFFTRFVPDRLRPHLGVNFDLAHQLVEFEDLSVSLALLRQQGIPVAKIHVSNAAEMVELKPFYADSIYLHQVTGCDAGGHLVYFSLDWPRSERGWPRSERGWLGTPPPAGITKFRCHYHLPVFPTGLQSTLPEVETFLRQLGRQAAPLIIETYTWPEQLRGRQHLVANICQELEWVRRQMQVIGKALATTGAILKKADAK